MILVKLLRPVMFVPPDTAKKQPGFDGIYTILAVGRICEIAPSGSKTGRKDYIQVLQPHGEEFDGWRSKINLMEGSAFQRLSPLEMLAAEAE